MFFSPNNQQLARRLARMIPEMEQIVCERFANFLTVDVASDNSWAHSGKLLHEQHIEAVAYLQANYKNHIVNRQSISNYSKLLQNLKQMDSQELYNSLVPTAEKISEKNRKQFFIFDHNLKIEELMSYSLVENRSYNKIICFPKAKPLQMNSQFQKFCLHHNVKALGLTDFSLKSLMNQIVRLSSSPTLIHEIINEDLSVYTEKSQKGSIAQLIILLNKIGEQKLKSTHKFISFKQVAKNYMFRESFDMASHTRKPQFKICRFQHLKSVQKYAQAIFSQDKIMRGQNDQ